MPSKTKNLLMRALKTLVFPVCVCLFFAIATGGRLFTSRSVLVILRQSVLPAIVIMAMMPNLTLGLMDFSIGAVVIASAIIGGNLMNMTQTGIPGLLVFSVLSGVILTSFTGFLNNKLRVPILVIALGLMLVYEALPKLLFPGNDGGAIIKVKYAMLAQQPYIFVVFAVAFAVFYILVNKTVYGHNILAMGGNDELARRAGLNVDKIKQICFTTSGFFAGIAGALYMASNGQVNSPSAFSSMTTVMDAFLGLFLGIFLSRFCNVAIGLVIAVVTMTTMSNGLVTMGLDATYRDIVKSIVLFFLLAFSGNQPYFVKWRANKRRGAAADREYQKQLSA